MSTIRDDGSTIKSGMGGDTSGTVRSSGGDIGSGYTATGTVHAGPDISSGMHGTFGIALNPGDPLVIKTLTYRYEGVITKSTGEAEIYLLSKDNKKCVFKLYYPNFKPKDDILKKLVQLNHEDIINVLDYGYHEDRFFEIMDYAEGGTLEKYLPIKDVKRIKQIVKETVNAYLYCHDQGIIHKDIKPQNLYFKNGDGTDLLIGDFGISTLLETGMSRHLTSQALTVGYAAPEMYGISGKVYVGKEVDYYALGVTLIHLWDGKSPFENLHIHAIANLTSCGKVHIPNDMPQDLQKLTKGLITVDYTKRWGYNEVSRWLKGEDVPVHFQVKEISYPSYQFSSSDSATTSEELAEILKKNLDKGKKHLYSGKLSAWVNLFNQGLAVELDRIIEDDYPKDQDAGIQKAIYILNPDEPFRQEITQGEKGHFQQRHVTCRTSEELADVLEGGFTKYTSELTKPNHPFYLYLEAHDAQNEADTFRKYFKTFSTKKALNTIILELRGRDKFKLGGELFLSPEELLRYKDQQYLVDELKDTESALSLWIESSEFEDIKKQVDKWRKLNKQDTVTFAYALSQKSNPFLSDILKELNDKYIMPAELYNGLQSEIPGMFMEKVEQYFYLYDFSILIEKDKYESLINEAIVPKELMDGIRAHAISKYTDSAYKLKEMINSISARMSKDEYQSILDNYRMPANIISNVNNDNYQIYETSIARIRQLKLLKHVDYDNLDNYLLPKELLDELSADDIVFEDAVKKLQATALMSNTEYQLIIDDYVMPANIINGVNNDNYKVYKTSIARMRQLRLLKHADYENLKKYLLPKELLDGLASDDASVFENSYKRLQTIDKIKITLVAFKKYTEEYCCPKELNAGLTSDKYDVHTKALRDYRDLEKDNVLISKEEYRKLKSKYFVPREINKGINSDNLAEYTKAHYKLQELQKNGKLKNKVHIAICCVLIVMAIIGLICSAIYSQKSLHARYKKASEALTGKQFETALTEIKAAYAARTINNLDKIIFLGEKFHQKFIKMVNNNEYITDNDLDVVSVESYYALGLQEINKENWARAIEMFESAMKFYTNSGFKDKNNRIEEVKSRLKFSLIKATNKAKKNRNQHEFMQFLYKLNQSPEMYQIIDSILLGRWNYKYDRLKEDNRPYILSGQLSIQKENNYGDYSCEMSMNDSNGHTSSSRANFKIKVDPGSITADVGIGLSLMYPVIGGTSMKMGIRTLKLNILLDGLIGTPAEGLLSGGWGAEPIKNVTFNFKKGDGKGIDGASNNVSIAGNNTAEQQQNKAQPAYDVINNSKNQENNKKSQSSLQAEQAKKSSDNRSEGKNKDVAVNNYNLTIKSEPEGASVLINKKEVGMTPLPLNLSPGSYGIMLKKYGYKNKGAILKVSEEARQSKLYELEKE